MSKDVGTLPEWEYGVADHAGDPVTILSAACLLRQIHITQSPSHDIVVKDGSTTVFIIPANAILGSKVDHGDVKFLTSLIIDFDGSSTTGTVTAVFKANHDGQAGGGAGLP